MSGWNVFPNTRRTSKPEGSAHVFLKASPVLQADLVSILPLVPPSLSVKHLSLLEDHMLLSQLRFASLFPLFLAMDR